jgi:hypothetical protein
MSVFTNFVSQMGRHNQALRKLCGGWGKQGLKDQIAKAVSHLAEIEKNPSKVDFVVLLDPYFTATILDLRRFHPVVLDCFWTLFAHGGFDPFPSADLTERVLKTAIKIWKPDYSDEYQMKFCKICSASFASPAGRLFVHAGLVSEAFNFFIQLHSRIESPIVQEVAAMTIQEQVRSFIERYASAENYVPKFDSVEEMSKFYAALLVRQAVAIHEFAKDAPGATIRDVDMIVVVRVFTGALGAHKLPVNTQSICSDALSLLLESASPFLGTQAFLTLLRTDIHVALLALALDMNPPLANATSRLIQTIWKKFAHHYLQGLNEVVDRGIAAALTSPVTDVIRRTLRIFNALVKKPQFLVDAFVNYDCDQSGFFRNIFHNAVTSIAKLAYPDKEPNPVQLPALTTLVEMLENLWNYFVKRESKKENQEEEQEDTANYLNAKKVKDIFDHGLEIFKKSSKKGLQFFIEHEIVESDGASIAHFLFNTAQLDPVSVGEVIGGSDPLNIEILRDFVNHFAFAGMSFESAFRHFLSKFQIPGEAQMIDRVMEQFGRKFYTDNSSLFSCADTVYVLAFSTLMLHTDAHHPNVRQRMTLEQFVANNRGIDGGKNLSYGFLETLYKGITSERINLSVSSLSHPSLLTQAQRADLYKQQCNQTLQRVRERITVGSDTRQFHRAKSANLIGPMFQSVWGVIMAALTNSFYETNDMEIIRLCLKGFQFSTHIASHCYIDEALATIIDSFAKFGKLPKDPTGLSYRKYILGAQAVIDTAVHDRKFLKGAWEVVLSQLSALFRAEQTAPIGQMLHTADVLFPESLSLDRESVLDFAQAMCTVSGRELRVNDPKPYILTKFGDFAYWNMNRPMYIWNEIWTIIGGYLSKEGYDMEIDPTLAITKTIIDVIRQLCRKFLAKQEMMEFHFQQRFLTPFLTIYDRLQPKSHQNEIRQLILECVESIAIENAEVLQSGWAILFRILQAGAHEQGDLKTKAFRVLEVLLEQVLVSMKPHAVHLMMTITDFVTPDKHNLLPLQAVGKFVLIAGVIQGEDDEKWNKLFLSLMSCLSHPDPNVGQCAEEIIISIVTSYGCMRNSLSPAIWRMFLQTILTALVPPTAENPQHSLQVLTNLYIHLFSKFQESIAPYRDDVLRFLIQCCEQGDRQLRDYALTCTIGYVVDGAAAFADDDSLMDLLVESFGALVKKMTASVLFVEIVAKFIDVFAAKGDAIARFMDLLTRLSDECRRVGDGTVHNCWCAARLVYFRNLIAQKRRDDIAEYLRQTLEAFVAFGAFGVWRELVVSFLGLVTELETEVFEECAGTSLQLICSLIENDSKPIRKQVVDVLKRKLGK